MIYTGILYFLNKLSLCSFLVICHFVFYYYIPKSKLNNSPTIKMVVYPDQQQDNKKGLPASSSSSFKKMTSTSPSTMLLFLGVLLLLPSGCNSFISGRIVSTAAKTMTTPATTIPKTKHKNTGSSSSTKSANANVVLSMVRNLRDPDEIELLMGGQRYELVPLPDIMLDTTIFVGNLCEFAQDEDLSRTFQSVSTLQSVPACVARRPNSQSLEYGFVSFPTVEEKEAAIIRFQGFKFMGRRLRVEEISDDKSKGRVRVPERMVSYVLGVAKKIPKRKNNDLSMRRTSPRIRKRGVDEDRDNNSNRNNNNNNSNNNNNNLSRARRDRKRENRRQRRNIRINCDEDFFIS